ncbi:hypothetical protein [Yersinia similis]|uniref:hypothetical protein n=1 Tax=Yersinia similis TaxID=367190 RepID=UPI0011A5BEE8|nr:hypothetical protein [Yersinia similis]
MKSLVILLALLIPASVTANTLLVEPKDTKPALIDSLSATFAIDKIAMLKKEKGANESNLYLPFEQTEDGLAILFGDINQDGKIDALVPFTWEGLNGLDQEMPSNDWYSYYAIYLQDDQGWKQVGQIPTGTFTTDNQTLLTNIEDGVIYGEIMPRMTDDDPQPQQWVLRAHPEKDNLLVPIPTPQPLANALTLNLSKKRPLTRNALVTAFGEPINIGDNYFLVDGDCVGHPDWKYYQYPGAAFNVSQDDNSVGVSHFIGIPDNLSLVLGDLTITQKTSAHQLIKALSQNDSFTVSHTSTDLRTDLGQSSPYFDDANDIFALRLPYYTAGFEAWAKKNEAREVPNDEETDTFTRQFYFTTTIGVAPIQNSPTRLMFYFLGDKMVALSVIYDDGQVCI